MLTGGIRIERFELADFNAGYAPIDPNNLGVTAQVLRKWSKECYYLWDRRQIELGAADWTITDLRPRTEDEAW